MPTVRVHERFLSIQGEASHAGFSCWFVRLAGCNLRCRYCDTRQAYDRGTDVDVRRLADECLASGAALAQITGGEPLLQPSFPDLAVALRDRGGRPVLVETNGSLDLSIVPENVSAVMDIKCPGSGESESTDWGNLARLRPYDDLKFVLTDRADFDWAADRVRRYSLENRGNRVFFSPVWGRLAPARLARWLIESGLRVRLQTQLHRILGMR